METNNKWVNQKLAALAPHWTPDVDRGLRQLRGRRHVPTLRAWKWSAVAGIAALGLLAFPTPRAAAHYCLNCSAALWQNIAARMDPDNAREPAPDFILNDASGRPVRLSSFKGKVVLLNFWATWCGGCKVEIPWFIDFQRTFAGRDLQVLGVSFDDDGWKLVKPYIAAKQVNYPVMIGDSHFASLYGGVEALPVTLLIDKSGRIAARHLGVVSQSDYRAEIEKLIAEP